MNFKKALLTLLMAAVLFFPSLLIAGEDPTLAPGYYPKEYVSMKNPLPFSVSTLREGRRLYVGHCETCHGVYGDGKGNSAVIGKFEPMPRDFTDDNIMSKKTDGMLYYSISKGVHGTRMFAREEIMPVKERWAVIHYVRTFSKAMEKEK
ncbi:MAG: cytochrome c [Nitrospira sp.]|nr:cytochrome c [Nitrospira sp.]